ncbi:helix-turn-helix domain-containing protein [Ruminococcus difficilis]|uniref:Helix-turn-helix domain-containing protein n=1 Tax=Ruminococcus difficilis TaxID=2763069 RepID=A0A934WUA9_9FIRM|nr:helix-turn-helix domain-containing protein [Ruminococcus difficilis]MBK6090024.1 helix-turn-helix domain-containing protein [Ruminococcus difficilis]
MQKETTFLNVKDVAEIMGISIPTARKLFEKRDFPTIRVGRRLLVSEDAFRKYMMQRHS